MHTLAAMPARSRQHLPRQRAAAAPRATLPGREATGPHPRRAGWPRYLDTAGRGGGTLVPANDRSGGAYAGGDEERDVSGNGGPTPAPAPGATPPSPPAPVAPTPATITTTTTTGPTWRACREFEWVVDWATTGRSGFIVQEIINAGAITRCDGTSVAPPNTPHFWEAWAVDASGTVGDGGADRWFRAPRRNTSGVWSLLGLVFFVNALDPAAGFSRTAVPDANGLMATTTRPGNLPAASLARFAWGVWNCCDGNSTHSGTAVP